jgi:hypothetical protein
VFDCDCKGAAPDLSVLSTAYAASRRMGEILAMSCHLCSSLVMNLTSIGFLLTNEACVISLNF